MEKIQKLLLFHTDHLLLGSGSAPIQLRPLSLIIFIIMWLLQLPVIADGSNIPQNKAKIIKIDIVGNRVRESIIHKQLTFKEGDFFSQEKIAESKKNLYRLGIFKSLTIEKEWNKLLNEVKITINARDGWYIFPWPLAGNRGGESYAGLLLMEQNLFKSAEGMMFFGTYKKEELSGIGSIFLPGFYILGGIYNRSLIEYQYQDGGFNSKAFWGRKGEEEPEEFGEIINSYEKEVDMSNINFGLSLSRKLRGSIGLKSNDIKYDDALVSLPEDTGKINSMILTIRLGKGSRSSGGFLGGFGRIFGMGMAGIKDSLKPLPRRKTTRGGNISLEKGDKLLDSDFEFSKVTLGINQSTTFRKRSRLSLSLKSSLGLDLPPSQLFATNSRGGLKGVYVREYRGDKIVGTNINFFYPFFRNMTSSLSGDLFLDYAICWKNRSQWEKRGVGFNFAYRFWRFPLPFGFGYTYSIDDKNWQTSFAVGGMF